MSFVNEYKIVNKQFGVNFVRKDDKYGVVDKNGREIISCRFNNYSDAYDKWRNMGFPTKPVNLSNEEIVVQKIEDALNEKHDELIASGDITALSFPNSVGGAEFVSMSDGSIGIAVSNIVWESQRGKNLEIRDKNGDHVMFLSEPELYQGVGTPGLVLCSDENRLYAATYNADYSYIACYRMGDFEKVWKTPMYGSLIQSIAVNDDEVVAFDMQDGKIKYFDKHTGKRNEDKEIDTKEETAEFTVTSHHNLATTNERLFAGVPGLNFGLLQFENELKLFDNASGESIAKKSISQFLGTLKSLAIDQRNQRFFIGFNNMIGVIGNQGYEGYFLAPTGCIHQLNFDQESGYLMISMTDGKGKLEIYNPESITKLLQTSRELHKQIKNNEVDDLFQIEGSMKNSEDSSGNMIHM